MPRCNPEFDYTKVPNHYLRDKELSLKAKGLLTQILSLPEDWRLGITVFEGMNSDGQVAIASALKELEARGYLERRTVRQGIKIVRVDYILFPNLQNLNQGQLNQGTVNRDMLNHENLNGIKELSNKGLSVKELSNKELSNKAHTVGRGDFKNVVLTDEEYEKLKNEIGDDCDEAINHLSKSMAMHNTTYANHYNTVLAWYREDKANGRYDEQTVKQTTRSQSEVDMLAELKQAREEMF